MKTRQGFVSNSSSSSFCIMGTVVPKETHDKISEARWKTKTTNLNTRYGIDEYYDCVLAGFDVGQMKDDETLAQFKKRCQDELAVFGVTEKVDWCVDGGRDS